MLTAYAPHLRPSPRARGEGAQMRSIERVSGDETRRHGPHALRHALPLFLMAGFWPLVARHDGEIPGPRPFAAAGDVGALRGPNAVRDAVRVGQCGTGILAHAAAAVAARPLGVLAQAQPRAFSPACAFCRSPKRRRSRSSRRSSSRRCRIPYSASGRLGRASSPRSPASCGILILLRPGSAVFHPAALLLDRRRRSATRSTRC